MKRINILFVFIAALFIGVVTVNAGVSLKNNQCTASETSQNPQTCGLSFDLSGDPIKTGRELTVAFFNPTNIKDNKITIAGENGWKVKGVLDTEFKDSITITISSENTYVLFKYTGDADITAGNNISYASVQYDKEDIGIGCGFQYGAPACKQVEGANGTIYYGENGSVVTKDEWAEQCTCQVKTINGVKWYYELDGQVFTKDDTPGKTEAEAAAIVVKECFPCQEIEFDGTTYFVGKEGNIVASKEEMDKECEIPKCKVVDDKYYDKDGKEITEEEYNKQCKCRIEENENGKLYYNDKNELISAEEYANQCQPSVPTGASIPYMMIAVGGLLTLVTLVFILRNKSKLKRI